MCKRPVPPVAWQMRRQRDVSISRPIRIRARGNLDVVTASNAEIYPRNAIPSATMKSKGECGVRVPSPLPSPLHPVSHSCILSATNSQYARPVLALTTALALALTFQGSCRSSMSLWLRPREHVAVGAQRCIEPCNNRGRAVDTGNLVRSLKEILCGSTLSPWIGDTELLVSSSRCIFPSRPRPSSTIASSSSPLFTQLRC